MVNEFPKFTIRIFLSLPIRCTFRRLYRPGHRTHEIPGRRAVLLAARVLIENGTIELEIGNEIELISRARSPSIRHIFLVLPYYGRPNFLSELEK